MLTADEIEKVHRALKTIQALQEKIKMQAHALRRETFQKVYWQRKVKYYAPNKISEHYTELDALIKEAGFDNE